MLLASDEETAYRKAMSLGKKVQQEEMEEAEGEDERFTTEFLGLVDLTELRDRPHSVGTRGALPRTRYRVTNHRHPAAERIVFH